MPAKRSSRASARPGFLPILAWGALLGGAVALRAIAWSRTTVLFNDGPIFLALAEAITQGHWQEVLAHPYHPLYPFSIAQVARSGLSLESSAIVVSIVGALIGIVALFAILDRLFDRQVAWLGAVALALHPWAVDFSSDVMSDGLYLGFYLAGLAALQASIHRPGSAAILCGSLAIALAYGVRPEGLGLLCVAFALYFVKAVGDDTSDSVRRGMLVNAMLLSIGTIALIAPYVAELSEARGELTLTQKKSIAGLVIDEQSPVAIPMSTRPPDGFALWLPQSSTVASEASENSARAYGRRIVESISLVLRTSLAAIRYEVIAFALLGVWALRRDPDRRMRSYSIGLPILLYSLLLVLLVWGAGYLSRRHALAAWVPVLGFAVVGWRTLVESIAQHVASGDAQPLGRARKAARVGGTHRPIVALSLIVALALVWGPRDLRARRTDRVSLRQAAEWLATHQPDAGPVAALKLRTAYYARSPFVPLPAGTERPIEADLREAGARWVIIDADRLFDHQGLEEGIGEWLAPLHSVEIDRHRAWVLEVLPEAAE